MARPGYGGTYPPYGPAQTGGYGSEGMPQATPGATSYSQSHPPEPPSQWTSATNPQNYPQQWQQSAPPATPPHTSVTPAAQYNPSAYGPMPGAQPQTYSQPLPSYSQVQQQQSQPTYTERPPSSNQNAYSQAGNPPARPPLTSVPSGYQTEVQQNQQGWPQHPPYSNQPPTQHYEPAWGQSEPPTYEHPVYGQVSQGPSYDTPPPPPPKQPTTSYPPPPPPKQPQPTAQSQESFSPTSVYSGDSASASSPNSTRPEFAQSLPSNAQQFNPSLTYRPDQSTPRPGSMPVTSQPQQLGSVAPPTSSASQRPAAQRPNPNQQQHGAAYSYNQPQSTVPGQAVPPAKPSQGRPTQARPPQAVPTQARPPQAGPTQARPPQAGPTQARPPQARPLQARPPPARPPQAGPPQTISPPMAGPPIVQSVSPPTQGYSGFQPLPAWQSQIQTDEQRPQPSQAPPHESQYDHPVEPVSPLQRYSVSSDRTEDGRFSISGGPSRTASLISRDSISVSDILSPPPMPEKRLAVSPTLGTANASALGFGGPGDWEYYGAGPEEIDDTAMYGSKSEKDGVVEPQPSHVVELPSGPSPTEDQGRPVDEDFNSQNDGGASAEAPQRSNEPSPRSTPVGIKVQPVAVQQNQVPAPRPISGYAQSQHEAPAPSSTPVQKQGLSTPKINSEPSQSSTPAPGSFVVDDGTIAAVQNQSKERGPESDGSAPAEEHPAALQDFHHKINTLQATVDQQEQTIQELKQRFDEARRTAEKEASDARKARNEMVNLQNQVVQQNAAHAVVKEELNNQRDRFQSKLADSETALSTLKEQHEKEVRELQKQLSEAKNSAEATEKSLNSERENLQAEIVESGTTLMAKEAEVNSLRKQLEEQKQSNEELRKQMEEEKAKSAAASDTAPGLDPWFRGSLERFRDALRAEAAAPTVPEKLKSFINFVNAESRLRGVDLPFGPAGEPKGFSQQPQTPPRDSNPERPKVKSPPSDYVIVEPDQYSPGGRPIVHRASEAGPKPSSRGGQRHGDTTAGAAVDTQRPSTEPAPLYKPYRRDGSTSRERPIQQDAQPTGKRPAIDTNQPAYKPLVYHPVANSATSPTAPWNQPHPPPFNRAAASAPAVPTQGTVRPQEEALLEDLPSARPRNYSTDSEIKDPAMLPQPLKPKAPGLQPPAELDSGTPVVSEGPTSPLERLAGLLQCQTSGQQQTSPRLEALLNAVAGLPTDYSWIAQLSQKWDHGASGTRDRRDKERRERLAAVEQRSNDLFDAGEIGYEDIGVLEEKAKEDEAEREAKEEKEEYESYAKEVFGEVWARLEQEMGKVVGLEDSAAELVNAAVAGRQAIVGQDGGGSVGVGEAIAVLLQVHSALEARYEKRAEAVRERDRKYKRTETKPLYAKGDIAGMKKLEKHFEVLEKRTDVKMKVEKVERAKVLWKKVESAVRNGMKKNEEFVDEILGAVEAVREDESAKERKEKESLSRAKDVLGKIAESSKVLMQHFEAIEMDLNDSEYEVSVASARLEGAGADVFENLKKEKAAEDRRLSEESNKRLADIEQDCKDGEHLINDALGLKAHAPPAVSEEAEKKARLEAALKEARRRNGEVI